MYTFLQELKKREMLHNTTPGIEKLLSQEKTAAYIGFDATAPSLHIGNLSTIMLLRQLQLAGHAPVIVLGGATTMIGDPSWKKEERKLVDKERVFDYQTRIQKQLSTFLDFSGPHKACILNNYDWFKNMPILTFLREVGKYITINYMMGKESVKKRLETGISYTEFAYQLLQAYDFYHLYTQHGVKMQMGGADQWGNITTGIEFIRKKANKTAYGLTAPLMIKTDGVKFGKTETGNIWLSAAMTSPYALYQFLLNTSDNDAIPLVKRFVTHPIDELENMIVEHQQAPEKRLLQKTLAKSITTLVHGNNAYQKASHASNILFGTGAASELYTLGSYLQTCLQEIPHITIARETLTENLTLIDLLTDGTEYKIFSSKKKAREIIQAGGLRINKERITHLGPLSHLRWIDNQYLLVQKGKKSFYVIKQT